MPGLHHDDFGAVVADPSYHHVRLAPLYRNHMFTPFLFLPQCTMPKVRTRRNRKITVNKKSPVVPLVAPDSAPAPTQTARPMSLAEYSVRIGAQRLREQKAQARADAAAAAAAAAAKEVVQPSVSESTSATTDYITPVSSQDPGADPPPTQRGPPQPLTYFRQLFDAKTPYFDGPHIPNALRQRAPWIARDPPKPESSQRHRPGRPRNSARKKPPRPQLTLCESHKSCSHSYCYYRNLHESESESFY